MRGLRAETSAASVPAEVMQLIITTAKIHLADDPAVLGRIGMEINDAYTVVLSILAVVEQRHIKQGVLAALASPLEVKGKKLDQASKTYYDSPLAKYPPKNWPTGV